MAVRGRPFTVKSMVEHWAESHPDSSWRVTGQAARRTHWDLRAAIVAQFEDAARHLLRRLPCGLGPAASAND